MRAGCRVVVAESYARIFFRNSISTGELYPCESQERLCEIFETGEEVEVDMEADKITRISTGAPPPSHLHAPSAPPGACVNAPRRPRSSPSQHQQMRTILRAQFLRDSPPLSLSTCLPPAARLGPLRGIAPHILVRGDTLQGRPVSFLATLVHVCACGCGGEEAAVCACNVYMRERTHSVAQVHIPSPPPAVSLPRTAAPRNSHS